MDTSAVSYVGRSRWIAALGVSFVALLALALVPAFLGRQEAALERELAVFSLARPIFPEIQLVHSREMMRIEQYVSSGDSNFIALYQDDLIREGQLLNDLRRVISGMPPTYRVELSQVESRANDWRVLHSPLMAEGPLSIGSSWRFGSTWRMTVPVTIPFRWRCRAFEDRLIRDASFRRPASLQRQSYVAVLGHIGHHRPGHLGRNRHGVRRR